MVSSTTEGEAMARQGSEGCKPPRPPLNKRRFFIPADVRALKEYGRELIERHRAYIREVNGGK